MVILNGVVALNIKDMFLCSSYVSKESTPQPPFLRAKNINMKNENKLLQNAPTDLDCRLQMIHTYIPYLHTLSIKCTIANIAEGRRT